MHYSLVRADSQIQVGTAFKVKTLINWSKSEVSGVETWTVDGPHLQRLIFFKGVEAGKPLLEIKKGNEENVPMYTGSMTSIEIMELIEATLARSGGHSIATKDLRPEKFGGLSGFRFDFSYMTESGLKYNGFFVGAQKNDRLLGIMYLGTALHHYNKHIDDVEGIISSVEIL
jgi:hypothetical protein